MLPSFRGAPSSAVALRTSIDTKKNFIYNNPTFNKNKVVMGINASESVMYGKPLVASLPAVKIYFFEAVLDKAYLAWLDVSKLLEAFPKHVQDLGGRVTVQGPVMIVKSMSSTRRLFIQCGIAFGAAVLVYIFLKMAVPKKDHILITASGVITSSQHRRKRIVLSLITGLGAYYLAGRYLPTQAGVYFLGQPAFLA